MIKTRSQTDYFFQYKKLIEELVRGIERDIFRVINTLNKKDKKSQQYLKVVGLTKKKEYQKVFNENKPLKNENEKMNVEKNRS